MDNRKVAKFGGTSLASRESLEKVLHIIGDKPERRIIVVSAPGRRKDQEKKVTDLLLDLARTRDETLVDGIMKRFSDIYDAGLVKPLEEELRRQKELRVFDEQTPPTIGQIEKIENGAIHHEL